LIEKFDPERPLTAVYLDAEKEQYNVKRFRIETSSLRTKFYFIKEGKENRIEAVTTDEDPVLMLHSGRGSSAKSQKIQIGGFVEVMGWKAIGNKLVDYSKSLEMEWETKSEDDVQAKLF
jgi:topoisomerase-4 subunit A